MKPSGRLNFAFVANRVPANGGDPALAPQR
jgi:hypothetical protein